MPTIDVSDEQRAFLRALRDELQSEVQYGSVREQDALQYLIDHFEGDADLGVAAELDVDAGAVIDGGEDASADGGAVAASADTSDEDGDGGSAATGDDGRGASGGAASSASDDGEDRLNAMMNLLDTHGDKWGEATQGDARYEVDMPDGSTAYVQTKDDVRAHIYKNYD